MLLRAGARQAQLSSCAKQRASLVNLRSFDKTAASPEEAVMNRRKYLERITDYSLLKIPTKELDYESIKSANCENVIGYVPVPLGVAGPLLVDGVEAYVPLATTEGALVASTSRGIKAITESGGAKTIVLKDGISRGPALEMDSLDSVKRLVDWVADKANFSLLQRAFAATSPYVHLDAARVHAAGRLAFLRFVCRTGDAMGMNMVGCGTERALRVLRTHFPHTQPITLSGNLCIDKKSSGLNWIEGRGKSVIAEALVKRDIVKTVLKTTPEAMYRVNVVKNYIGSSLAAAIGGNNAHAANIISAFFIACGQDPAQVVDSAACITTLDITKDGDLLAHVTLPALEVGAVGGGTRLAAQQTCLRLTGAFESTRNKPGDKAKRVASVAAAAVLGGELSLIAALATGDLMKAHLKLNRKQEPTKSSSSAK